MNYYIDLFAGAGGTTCAIEEVSSAKVIAAVNHDALAIKSHKENHPDVLHFVEDVRNMEVIRALKKLVNQLRKAESDCKIFIWASLECTNFSKAKGGKAREADSRSLADIMFEYEKAINPDGIWIENVEEFMSWGPLDENGKPISKRAGSDYMKWVNKMIRTGFQFDWRILNSADYGGITTRKRYFAQFMRPGIPIVWPTPTYAKRGYSDAFGEKKTWRAVKEILDFSNKGESIFTRKKPLVENTLKRIYAGLIKYVANGDDSFVKKYYSGRPMGKVISIEGPAGTVKTVDGQALVQCAFLSQQHGGNPNHHVYNISRPARTVNTGYIDSLVQPEFLVKYFGNSVTQGVDQPSGTVTTKDRMGLIQPAFIEKRYSSDRNHSSIESPAGTVLANDKHSLVYIVKNFSQGGQHASVEDPNGALVTVPKENLVTIRKYHYLVNPQYNSKGGSVDDPCFTLIARMDKMPPYLVQVVTEDMAIIIYDDDNETMRKIKLFMAAYGIINIYMRMLTVEELLQIQGFSKSYILRGTKADQKKFIGNSVEKYVGAALIREQVKAINAKSNAS